jgi:hypothetical protein
MQPPSPRKPVPQFRLEQEPRHPSASTHHPQEPTDMALGGAPHLDKHLAGTRDARLVRAWADYHGAEPATGEATASGPATVNVNDQGSGLRFNFPGAARFREVTWDEWLAHFDETGMVFVFEITPPAGTPSGARFGGAFYRLLSAQDWGNHPLATLATD